MPTKRTPIGRDKKSRITPESVALYRQLREIFDNGDDEQWREACDLRRKLNQLLGRSQPWLNSVFWTIASEQCAHPPGTGSYQDWPTALALRKALDEAIGK